MYGSNLLSLLATKTVLHDIHRPRRALSWPEIWCFNADSDICVDGTSDFIWRFPIAFQVAPLLFLLGIVFLMPESPRWLVKVGREDEARYILGRLRGESGDDAEKSEAEFQDIHNICELERKTAKQQNYLHMFLGIGSGKLHTGRRVQLVVWLQIMQEWIGIAGTYSST